MLKKSTSTITKSNLQSRWLLLDAKDKILGKLASKAATLLLGKEKTSYSPHLNGGDFVIVTNCRSIVVTGRKESDKNYYRYSGYPGGLKVKSLEQLRKEVPEQIIKHAVWGMLPKNRLGKQIIGRLYLYSGNEHPHSAQKPEEVKI